MKPHTQRRRFARCLTIPLVTATLLGAITLSSGHVSARSARPKCPLYKAVTRTQCVAPSRSVAIKLNNGRLVHIPECPANKTLPMTNGCYCGFGYSMDNPLEPEPLTRVQKSRRTFRCEKVPPSPHFCEPGQRKRYTNHCACPPGTKHKLINKSYSRCVILKRVPLCPRRRVFSVSRRCRCPKGTKPAYVKPYQTVRCVKEVMTMPFCQTGKPYPKGTKCACRDDTRPMLLLGGGLLCRNLLPKRLRNTCPVNRVRCTSGPHKGTCYPVRCPKGYRYLPLRCRCCARCVKIRK